MPYYRFTEEELERVNHINIIEYAKQQLGLETVEYCKGYWKIPGWGGLLLTPDKWYWELEHRGGGPIQFVMMIKHLSWLEAVKDLLNVSKSKPECLYYSPINSKSLKNDNKKEKSNFRLPAKNQTYDHIFAYLIHSRKLDVDLVKQMVKEKKLYEDVQNNCVFVGYNQKGEPRAAFIRGTKTFQPYKGDAAGSDKRFAFFIQGTSPVIYVFESPIDLLSYLTLLKQAGKQSKNHYISLAGISLEALEEYLSWHRDIEKIVCCTDNDKAGNAAFQKIFETYGLLYKIKRQAPKPYKDFNDYLVKKQMNDYLKAQGLSIQTDMAAP